MRNEAIVSIQVKGVRDLALLQETVQELKKHVHILSYSAVYEKLAKAKEGDLQSPHRYLGHHLCTSLFIETELNEKALLQVLDSLHQKENEKVLQQADLRLLTFNNEVSMVPSIPLPHPDFHKRAEYLVPSHDVRPTYMHPVLDQTLHELFNSSSFDGELMFYAQAKALQDKSEHDNKDTERNL